MERFLTAQRVLIVKAFHKMENLRRKQYQNFEPFLAEMKFLASLLYAN